MLLTRLGQWSLAVGLMFSVGACDHGDVPVLRERAQQAWSEVQNQYRQRADQVPPLVETVRKKAPAEREVLDEVVAAHNEVVATLNTNGFIAEPERFRHYERTQRRLTTALANLYDTTERYPELSSDTRFAAQLAELQRLEDRLVVARSDLISAVGAHNEELSGFPGSWVAAILNPDARPLTTFAQEPLERSPAQVRQ